MKKNLENESKSLVSENKFTWINFYQELTNKLLDEKQKNQNFNLKKFILQNNISKNKDEEIIEKHIEEKFKNYEDINPFTLFAIFNYSNNSEKSIYNRINIAKYIGKIFHINQDLFPKDLKGIPTVFAWQLFINDEQDINEKFWKIFESTIKVTKAENDEYNEKNEKYFNDSLLEAWNSKHIKGMITIGLFWIRPNHFISLEKNNMSEIKKLLNISENSYYKNILRDSDKKTLSKEESPKYLELCKKLKQELNIDFPQFSLDAYNNKLNTKEENAIVFDLKSKNYILFGPPGTGKTYSAKKMALKICENKEENIWFTTFHQSYDYEDFVEGIKPETSTKNIEYKIKPGIFKKICEEARQNQNNNYALIIDEINRGNISKIFGELITLIEPSKRAGENNQIIVTLPYSGDKNKFSVPKNVYIIGTMNTADRSISMIDVALRRRFDFIEMMPDANKLENITIKINDSKINLKEMLETINKRIEVLYDREHTIGHTYFMELANENSSFDDLKKIFKNKIIPLLQEYFYEDYHKIQMVLGDYQKTDENKFIQSIEYVNKNIFPKLNDDSLDIQEKIYEINEDAFDNPDSYINIYKTDPEE